MTDLTAPTDPYAATLADAVDLPASRAFITTMRIKVRALAMLSDQDLLALATDVARLSYAGEFAAVWRLGADLGLSDHEWQTFTRETLCVLYPVGISVAHMPEEDA